jgi:predicted nucleotidyltransferase
MIDLAERDLTTVIAILKKHVPDRRVCVFGSRAQGTAKKFSDLDLAVMTDKPLTFSKLSALREDFAESKLPFRVDIVDWATTNEEFRQVIQKNCQEIYRP